MCANHVRVCSFVMRLFKGAFHPGVHSEQMAIFNVRYHGFTSSIIELQFASRMYSVPRFALRLCTMSSGVLLVFTMSTMSGKQLS